MTIYVPDISSYQGSIRLAGALAVAIKSTEGTGYANPYYPAQAAEAQRSKSFQLAYHFLHQSSTEAQAVYAHSRAGSTPMMIDAEPTTGADGKPNLRSAVSEHPELRSGAVMASAPAISDICSFTDEYRSHGGTVWWVYLPRWYYQQLGSPSLKPLTDRGLMLWSSDYGGPYTDAGSGRGWQPYGGVTPQLWQYTASMTFGGEANVDFSAFRGSYAGKQDAGSVAACLAEFEALSRLGRVPPPPGVLPPVRDLTVKSVGVTSVKLSWNSPQGPSPWGVGWYQVTVRRAGEDLPGYPRMIDKGTNPEVHQFGSLPLQHLKQGEQLTGMVRAVDKPAKAHMSEWRTVKFPND